MIALDTNLLVWAHRREFGEHDAARALLAEVTQDDLAFGLPGVLIGEFLHVVNGFSTIVTNDRDFRRFDGLEVRPIPT